ncbi:MAG TPA: hypothetical protein VHC18_27535 [Amycolatopsis sp.]|nr:hypothetical protein [Amycolatopsis sp.]
MTGDERRRGGEPADSPAEDDPFGDTRRAQRETIRGEQGTSSGDPHDDTDPQAG